MENLSTVQYNPKTKHLYTFITTLIPHLDCTATIFNVSLVLTSGLTYNVIKLLDYLSHVEGSC